MRLLAAALLALATAWGFWLALRFGPSVVQHGLGLSDAPLSAAQRQGAPTLDRPRDPGMPVITPVRVPLDPPVEAELAPEPVSTPQAESGEAAALSAGVLEPDDAVTETDEAATPAPDVADPAASTVPPAAAGSDVAPPPAAVPLQQAPQRPRWVVASTTSVNLRVAPSTASRVLATLAPGTVVEESGGAIAAGGQGWRRVLWNGREGWIAANLLRPAP